MGKDSVVNKSESPNKLNVVEEKESEYESITVNDNKEIIKVISFRNELPSVKKSETSPLKKTPSRTSFGSEKNLNKSIKKVVTEPSEKQSPVNYNRSSVKNLSRKSSNVSRVSIGSSSRGDKTNNSIENSVVISHSVPDRLSHS